MNSLDDIFLKIGFGPFHICIIVLLGFIQFYDAVEMVLLGFLGPILQCSWRISPLQSSFITIFVFIGMTLGSISFGKLADIHGRRPMIMICLWGIFYFSLICSASPDLVWILITRSLIGIFIGGMTALIYPILVEFVPMNYRGTSIMCVQTSWSLGSFYLTFLTYAIIPTLGWRLWLVIIILPMVLIIICARWLPESPRFLLQANRKEEAIKIINTIALMNRSEAVVDIELKVTKAASFMDIFHRKYVLTTAILSYIWFVIGLNYYGYVLLTPIINNIPRKCLQNMSALFDISQYTNSSIDNSCCMPISWAVIVTVLISIAGESASYLMGIVLIRFMRRKIYLQILLLISGLIYFLLNLCLSPVNTGILIMFGRGAATALYGVNFIYASEVYPTTVRAFAVGFSCGFSRIGAISSSFIVNIIMGELTLLGGTLILLIFNVIAIILVFVLPYETKGRALLQNVDDELMHLEINK